MGTKTRYSYEITPRPDTVGGGWRLKLLEDGEEVSGGAFPPGDDGYEEALAEADEWLSTRRWEEAPKAEDCGTAMQADVLHMATFFHGNEVEISFSIYSNKYGSTLQVFERGERTRDYFHEDHLRVLSIIARLLGDLGTPECPRCLDKPLPQTGSESASAPVTSHRKSGGH